MMVLFVSEGQNKINENIICKIQKTALSIHDPISGPDFSPNSQTYR